MNRRSSTFALLVAASLVGACGGGEPQEQAAPQEAAQAAPAVDPASPLFTPATLTESAPETYRVRFETSAGAIVVQVNKAWAPNGADRFYNLVKNGYYDDTRFYRVVEGFMAQFGLKGINAIDQAWRDASFPDDPFTQSNKRGTITFAHAGPNTRTTQVFFNFKDNTHLDESGFTPFGEVVEGLDIMDKIYAGYGELPPAGKGPDYAKAWVQGNAYLDENFPEMTKVLSATLESAGA
ncbi:MAG TPA: peptidylprolyl isomerase [Longimicrobiales bacterium]|nr:peptidylprolyl isomerase [Longimicrobiales bacterium]